MLMAQGDKKSKQKRPNINSINMKKFLFVLVCICVSTLTYAQNVLLDSASLAQKPEFTSLDEALKTPLDVYSGL